MELRYGRLDFALTVVLGFLLALLSPKILAFDYIAFEEGKAVLSVHGEVFSCRFDPILVILSSLAVVTAHELIHIALFEAMGIDYKLSITKFGIALDYEGIYVWQYVIVAISPQMLTVMLRILSEFLDQSPLLIFSAILNLAGSAGDLYGIAKTIVKVRSLRPYMVRVGRFRYAVTRHEKV